MKGLFVIGKDEQGRPFSIESRKLVKHAVVLGATGSGKTVLCKNIIEQAVLNDVPVIAIDPKGDISTLAISNSGADFRPWSDGEANAAGKKPEKYAEELKKLYLKKYEEWGIRKGDISAFSEKAGISIYTPKGSAGNPLSISPQLEPPKGESENVVSAMAEARALSILKLVGYKEGSCDIEQAFLSQVILDAWRKGESLGLEQIVERVASPPFEKVGALPVGEFLPDNAGKKLKSKINLLLAKPTLRSWFEGKKPDFDSLFGSGKGRTSVSIIDLRWIDQEHEKQFFVGMFLQDLYEWMLKQAGTERLRCILYFDEIRGYFPSYPHNPPSKRSLELLIRQGRAFGLGCVLATQNPGDIDYKALSNIGSWFVGSLRVKQDINKIATGVEASPSELAKQIPKLETGQFMFKPASSAKFRKLRTKWLLSYHRGPLREDEIRKLCRKQPAKGEALAAERRAPHKHAAGGAEELYLKPELDAEEVISRLPDGLRYRVAGKRAAAEPFFSCTAHVEGKISEGQDFERDYGLFFSMSGKTAEFGTPQFDEKRLTGDVPEIGELADGMTVAAAAQAVKDAVVSDASGTYYANEFSGTCSRDKEEVLNSSLESLQGMLDKSMDKLRQKCGQKALDLKFSLEDIERKSYGHSKKIDKLNNELRDYQRQLKRAEKKKALAASVRTRERQIGDLQGKISDLEANKESKLRRFAEKYTKPIQFKPAEREVTVGGQRVVWAPSREWWKIEVAGKGGKAELEIETNCREITKIGKCSECEAVIKVLEDAHFCEECGALVCGQHAIKCAKCERAVCPKHAWKCGVCGKSFCTDERSAKCSECGKPSCPDCIASCRKCKRPFCKRHVWKCPRCGKWVCRKDSVVSADWKWHACRMCLDKCPACGERVCELVSCPGCGKSVCCSCLRAKKKMMVMKEKGCAFCLGKSAAKAKPDFDRCHKCGARLESGEKQCSQCFAPRETILSKVRKKLRR